MNSADQNFLSALFDGSLDKFAQLSAQSVSALDVQQPELLEQLEEQAAGRLQAPTEPAQQDTPPADAQADNTEPEVQQEAIEDDALAIEPQQLDPVKAPEIEVPAGFFKKAGLHPLHLLVVMKSSYDDAWVEWLPETLWTVIRKDFGPISDINKNKIQALAAAVSTDAPWQHWPIFENCGRAFNDTLPIFGQVQPLSPMETAFALAILKKLQDNTMSLEVLGYIAAVCLYNGIIYAPPKLFGNVQWLIEKQLNNKELIGSIKKAWNVVQSQDLQDVQLDDSKPVDVHVAKLWAVNDYLQGRAAQLKEA